jgi:hypothetical protein
MNLLLWVLQALLAAAFLAHGLLFLSPPPQIAAQINASLPRWFQLFLGVAEVLAAVGITLPGLTPIAPWLVKWAAVGIMIVTASATVFCRRGKGLSRVRERALCSPRNGPNTSYRLAEPLSSKRRLSPVSVQKPVEHRLHPRLRAVAFPHLYLLPLDGHKLTADLTNRGIAPRMCFPGRNTTGAMFRPNRVETTRHAATFLGHLLARH